MLCRLDQEGHTERTLQISRTKRSSLLEDVTADHTGKTPAQVADTKETKAQCKEMQGFRFLSLLPTHNRNTDIAIRKSEFGNSRRSPDRLKRSLKKMKRRKNLPERRFIFTKRRSAFVLCKSLIFR